MKTRFLAMLAAGVITVTTSSAEVRLTRDAAGQPSLVVQPTGRGIWAARHNSTNDQLVNPMGDLLGDGYPAQASSGGKLVSAWRREVGSSLIVMIVDDNQSTGPQFIELPLSIQGIPFVEQTDQDTLLVAQQVGIAAGVVAVKLDEHGTPSTIVDVPGSLVDVLTLGGVHHVLTLDAFSSQLNVATISRFDPIPIPIPISRIELRLAPMPRHARGELVPAWQPCVLETDYEVLLAWRTGDGQIGRVTFDEFGVGEPEFLRGPNGSCQAILNAAGRD